MDFSSLLEYKVEYAVIILSAFVIYLFYYILSKEAYYNKNIRSIASVVEDLNRDIFYLKKKLEESEHKTKAPQERMSDDEIYQEIERGVYDMTQPLALNVKETQENLEALQIQIDSRLSLLENGVKQFSMPSSLNSNDDAKIISLFKQGVPIETISKELHLSKPEVEFVLKINKIK